MDNIVLIHGLLRTKLSMRPLETYLKNAGYNVINFGYNSHRKDIFTAADELKSLLDAKNITSASFICHSLGSYIFRIFCQKYQESFHFFNSILLGAPNQGARIASFLLRFKISHTIFGVNLKHLGYKQNSFFNPTTLCTVGNVKGNLIFKSDLIVRIDEMHLDGATEALYIRCAHSFYMTSNRVKRKSLTFLKTGKFHE